MRDEIGLETKVQAGDPAPYTAAWWNSDTMRRLKWLAIKRANGTCERCGETVGYLIARLTTQGFRKVDAGEELTTQDFEAICPTCLDIARGKFRH